MKQHLGNRGGGGATQSKGVDKHSKRELKKGASGIKSEKGGKLSQGGNLMDKTDHSPHGSR
jgi:hypothetical protein